MAIYKAKNKGREVDNYLQSIIDSVGGSVYWKDANGVYLGANIHALKMVGLSSPKDIIGKTDYDLFPKRVADDFRENDLEVIKTKEDKVTEEKTISPDGTELTQLSVKRPLFNEEGEVVGVIGNTIDITDRKIKEKLANENALADQKIKYLKMLGGLIAHELRTPLGAIVLNYDLIENAFTKVAEAVMTKDPKLYTEKVEDNFAKALMCGEQIDNTVKKTAMTINLLLSNIKEEAIDKSNFGESSIISDIKVVLANYPFVGDELQKVHCLTSDAQDFRYLGNPVLTQLIITNLLKNALYHIRLENKGEIYISLKPGKRKSALIFHDTGPGIPKALLSKIFDRFVTGRAGGTGLGLAFCKMVMESYGGSITCDSKEGEYTTFTMMFPVFDDER